MIATTPAPWVLALLVGWNDVEPEAGAVTPANRWYTEAGCAARTGVSATAPLSARAPELAWSHDAGGTIEGEPLVWDDRVVVAVELKNGDRELRVLSLFDGAEVAKSRPIDVDAPLLQTLWEDTILVRAGPEQLAMYEIPRRGKVMPVRWKYDAGAPVHALLRYEDEVYVRVPGELRRLRVKGRKPEWVQTGGFVGRIALRGDSLYVAEFSGGTGRLAQLSRDDGSKTSVTPIGETMGPGPGLDDPVLVNVFADQVDVLHSTPIAGGGGGYNTSVVHRRYGQIEFSHLWDTSREATVVGGQRLQVIRNPKPLLALFSDENRFLELATTTHHVDFIEDGVPPTAAGSTVYVGGRVFDAETRRVLWKHGRGVAYRAVPARESLLLVDESRSRLDVLRRRASSRPLTPALVAEGEHWLKIVRRDGSITSGTRRIDAKKGTITRTVGRAAEESMEDLLVAVDKEGTVRVAFDGPSAVRGLLLLEDGGEDKVAGRLFEAYRSLPPIDPSSAGGFDVAFLRAVLERNPEHQGASARVADLLPAGMPIAEPFEALDWLDFVEALTHSAVEVVPGDFDESTPDLTVEQRQLGADRAFWRDDLSALSSDNLLIITPLSAPGRVSRCLALGELVCETLDQMFGAGAKRDERFPLRLQLFESQEEYLALAEKIGIHPSSLEWTAGHYSPSHDVTRVYLPADRDGFERVMQVYAHELTHHWVATRCPRFSSAEKRQSPTTPGFWLVEGFASFMDECLYDLDAWSWEPVNPRATSLDTIANSRSLLEWDKLFSWSQVHFLGLKVDPVIRVKTEWYLGAEHQLGAKQLFYDQSTATCQFLYHADGGKHRDVLLDLVALHYKGEYKPGELERRLSMSAAEIGAAVVAFARERIGS